MGTHPLALLSAEEITSMAETIRSKGLVGDSTTFRRMAVDESSPTERRLEVWLYDAATREITELIVAADSGEVVTSKTVTGQIPQMGFGEVMQIIETVRADPDVAAALAKRGIDDPSGVQIDPWPTGNMGLEHEAGRRVVRGIPFHRVDPMDNGYAKPVDGLMAFVDIDEMKVYRVDDFGDWPVPTETSNYVTGTFPERDDVKAIDICLLYTSDAADE